MHRGHPQPFVLVDDGREIFDAANRALERLGRWRPLILIPQVAAARQYMTDADREGRTPEAIIIRRHEQDDAPLALLDWIRAHPEPLRSAHVLVITDAVLSECEGRLDGWMENAFRQVLHLPEVARRESSTSVDASQRRR